MQRLVVLFLFFAGALSAETTLVLPFFNHSKSTNLDWVGESIAESVRDALASEGILVLDREDRLEAYRRLSLRPGAELTHASVLKIGESLDAAHVVYGFYELLPAGSRERSIERLAADHGANSGSEAHAAGRGLTAKWARSKTWAALQVHLGWQTLQLLNPKTAPAEREFMTARPAVRLDAVESYVRGLLSTRPSSAIVISPKRRASMRTIRSPASNWARLIGRRRTTRSPPDGWNAWHAPTRTIWRRSSFSVYAATPTAISRAPSSASNWWPPTLPLNEVYNDLGVVQAQRNDFAAAAASFRKALEGDDADPDYHFNLGAALWRSGQYSGRRARASATR